MARGAELGGAFLAAQVVDQYFKEVTLHVGVFAEEVDGRDDVHRAAERGPVGDDDGGVLEQRAGGRRKRGMEREFREQVAQGAEHPVVVGVGG
jgi:hypothetical protein